MKKNIPWYLLISRSKKELGVKGQMSEVRFNKTGHVGALRAQWLPSIGMWGGLHTADEIALALDIEDVQRVRVYANMTELTYRRQNAPDEAPFQSGIARAVAEGCSAESIGILPIEYRYYQKALPFLAKKEGLTLSRLLRCKPAKLHRLWDEHCLHLQYPTTPRAIARVERLDARLFR